MWVGSGGRTLKLVECSGLEVVIRGERFCKKILQEDLKPRCQGSGRFWKVPEMSGQSEG